MVDQMETSMKEEQKTKEEEEATAEEEMKDEEIFFEPEIVIKCEEEEEEEPQIFSGVCNVSPCIKKKNDQREQIIELWNRNICKDGIAEKLGICKKTVSKWIRRYEQEGSLRDHPRAGRPRIMTSAEIASVRESATDSLVVNCSLLKKDLNLKVSLETIRRRLKEGGVTGNEELEERRRLVRLQFATDYGSRDEEFWNRVVFTGRSTFSSTPQMGHHSGPPMGHSSSLTCSVWGWFHMNGLGELAEIEATYNSKQYIEILDEVFLPSVSTYAFPVGEKFIFVQDDSPLHATRSVRNWFKERSDRIELLYWPSDCWDLNPIEGVWENTSHLWTQEDSDGPPFNRCLRVWENYRKMQDSIHDLVSGLPATLQSCIENNGAGPSCSVTS